MKKYCGILCHITSLPNKYGYGCFSKEAYNFIDQLKQNNIKYWQTLPFNPINYDGSPFASCSLYAGNPLFIDLSEFLNDKQMQELKNENNNQNFSVIMQNCIKKLQYIYINKLYSNHYDTELIKFKKTNNYWLNDYATFMCIKDQTKETLSNFPKKYKNSKSKEIKTFNLKYKEKINLYKFIQFIFFKQWEKIKDYANKNSIKIIGDIPIYASIDSVDLWSQPEQFLVNKEGKLKGVAGVPPDYFTTDGQLWGNPLYDYKYMEKDNFNWWIKRLLHTSKFFDVIKIDHFRGFSSFWKIDPKSETAKEGKWIKANGKKLFTEIKKQIKTPLILEDLGIIDNEVLELKNFTKYPGMKVYQFGFDGNPNNPHLPQNYEENSIAYLGTHDNNTFVGFLSRLDPQILYNIKIDLNIPNNSTYEETTEKAIEKLIKSKSNLTIFTIQDLLFLSEEHRMNTPGTVEKNWKYQLKDMEEINKALKLLNNYINKYNRN